MPSFLMPRTAAVKQFTRGVDTEHAISYYLCMTIIFSGKREAFKPKSTRTARQEEVKEHTEMLYAKLHDRLRLTGAGIINLNFFIVESKLTATGNRTNKIIITLATPTGVAVDITSLFGSVFGYRVTRGGLLTGSLSPHDIRRTLFNRFGEQLKIKIDDIWINEIV